MSEKLFDLGGWRISCRKSENPDVEWKYTAFASRVPLNADALLTDRDGELYFASGQSVHDAVCHLIEDDFLLPCPFCGKVPKMPNGNGTQYEIECCGCGQAVASVQISDFMTIEERTEDGFNDFRHQERYIMRAIPEAVKKWNRRAE